jgi:hypothetical protein
MPPANKRNGFMSLVGHLGQKQQRRAARRGRMKVALAVAKPLTALCPQCSAQCGQSMRTGHTCVTCIAATFLSTMFAGRSIGAN